MVHSSCRERNVEVLEGGELLLQLVLGFFLVENSKYFISIPFENKVLDFVHYKWLLEAEAGGRWLLSPHEVAP